MSAGPIITLTTDFGTDSPYVAQMKAAILSVHPAARLVDITHSVPPQSIRAGVFLLTQTCSPFPGGSIHVAVIDPGVGSKRRILCAEAAGAIWIAPDNGLLWEIVQRDSSSVVREVVNPAHWRHPVSATFHGRDIMAPVAAHLSRGVPVAEVGETVDDILACEFPQPERHGHTWRGEVVWLDSFGNAITNLRGEDLAASREAGQVIVRFGGIQLDGISRTYSEGVDGETVALIGSSGLLELAVVNGNAGRRLGIRTGDAVEVQAR